MKTFIEVTQRFTATGILPLWYNQDIHSNLQTILHQQGKLHAVKYLRDVSNQLKNSNPEVIFPEIFLKECKTVCDFIVDDAEATTVIHSSLLDKTVAYVEKIVAVQGNQPLVDTHEGRSEQYAQLTESQSLLSQLKSLQSTLTHDRA